MKSLNKIYVIIFILSSMQLNAQNGLIGHWSFDTLEGDVFEDLTTNGNSGINQGAVLIDGIKGKALYFDGKSDFGVIGNEAFLPPEQLKSLGVGSISLWFRVDYIPLEHGIAPLFYYGGLSQCDFFDAANEGLIIEVGHSPVHHRSENLYFTIWKNGCTYPSFCFDSNKAISTGQWHHIVVVVNEASNTGYLDGREMTGRSYNFGAPTYSQFFEDAITHEVLWLGKGHWDRTEQYLEGALDELKIFDYPLSAAEVTVLYSDTTGHVTGIKKDSPDPFALQVYPNPATGTVTISGKVGATIGIYSIKGELMLEQASGRDQSSINISKLPPGTYVARSGEYRQKFSVER